MSSLGTIMAALLLVLIRVSPSVAVPRADEEFLTLSDVHSPQPRPSDRQSLTAEVIGMKARSGMLLAVAAAGLMLAGCGPTYVGMRVGPPPPRPVTGYVGVAPGRGYV